MKTHFENASILYLPSPNNRSSFLASVLSSEIKKRTFITLPCKEISNLKQDFATSAIYLAVTKENPHLPSDFSEEAYLIHINKNSVLIESKSERGLLFGVGRLLREMDLNVEQEYEVPLKQTMSLHFQTFILSAPKFGLRGHQIAYRPKTTTYDAFTVQQMQQEIIDCVLWGANTIEIIPPGLDDFQQSPHFQTTWLNMITEVSEFCDKLDIMVSIWYPAFFVDYSQAETMEKAITHWKTIFGALKRLDKLFVPGGDPGGRDPKIFLEVVEKQADFMRKNHFPKAEVWVSSQFGLAISGDLKLAPWNPIEYENRFYESLPQTTKWLTGGPWTADPIDNFRKNVPSNFPLRNYPDLCHSLKCECPVQNWDKTYAMTFTREGINPRPLAYARMIKDQAHLTDGCGCYSEGVNDDVNKVVWSALHWGVDQKGTLLNEENLLNDILLQYGKVHIKLELAGVIRELIYSLEKNWMEDPLDGDMVEKIFKLCNELDVKISSRDQRNWRLQMLLFRGYYDVFLGLRRREEIKLEKSLLSHLEQNFLKIPINQLLDEVISTCQTKPWLNSSIFNSYLNHQWPGKAFLPEVKNNDTLPNIILLINRLNMLAGALYQGIGIQVSVIWHGNVHTERGAPFDLAWLPMSDLCFLNDKLMQIKNIQKDEEKKEGVKNLIGLMKKESHLWKYSFGEFSKENTENEPDVIINKKRVAFSKVRELGEDPTYFYTPILDYADTNSLEILSLIANGKVKRSSLGWMTSIWPTLQCVEFAIPVEKIKDYNTYKDLTLEITYVGKDLWIEGGDWTDVNRTVEPTRLLVNGEEMHGFYDMPQKTKAHKFKISEKVIKEGVLTLKLEAKNPKNITIRTPILPVVEIKLTKTF